MQQGITPFFQQIPVKSTNCPCPSFLGNFPLYIGFLGPPPSPHKNRKWDFSVNPTIILKFFILKTPSHLLKLIEFLFKIFQFTLLVTTEKDILFIKFFLTLNISNFSLSFMKKLQPPLKKVTPSFPETPSQNWDLVKPALFENLVAGSTPPPPPAEKMGRGCTL